MTTAQERAEPPDWNVDVVASDGGIVHLRPIRPDDGDELLGINERSSDHTIYLRFFSYRRKITPAELERLVTVDYVDRLALVAELNGTAIGVGRYDRVGDDVAEVAFLVEDAHQHRGLGTLLLEHLAVLARRNGIDRFTAMTLAENRKMLGVFRAAGFKAKRRFEDGAYVIDFPIDHIDPDPLFRREHRADVASITPILRPSSVLVIGASHTGDGHGSRMLEQLRAGGFAGRIDVVHPGGGEIGGLIAKRTIGELAEPVDLAVLAVPADEVESVVTQLGEISCRSVIVVTSGFAEAGPEGEERIRALTAQVRSTGMRLVGPSSLGVVNTDPEVRLAASFAPTLPARGGFGFLSQSGMLAAAALERANAIDLGVSSFVSVGDKADVSGNDLLQFWEHDPRTKVVGLYLESFGNPRKFSRIARRVGRTTPIVTVKGGTSLDDELTEDVTDALIRQTGVVRVDTVQAMLDTAKVLADCPLPLGPRVQVIGNVGGAAVLCADACRRAGLELAELSDETLERAADVGAVPGPTGRPTLVPVAADRETWSEVIRTVLRDDGVDAVIIAFHAVLTTPAADIAEAIGQAAADSEGKPLLASMPAGAIDIRTITSPEGDVLVPVFPFPETPAHSLGLAHRYASWRLHRSGVYPEVPEALLTLADDAARWADGASRPADPDECGRLLQAAGIDLVLDEPTGTSYAIRIGIRQHPTFGPLVSARLEAPHGARFAARPAYRLAPLTDEDAASLLRHLPGSSELDDPIRAEDRPELIELVARIGAFAAEVEAIESADLGPVYVGDEGSGLLDVSITLRPGDAAHDLPVRKLS
ncbi:MAG: GNAT family N-acetyltransferase [Actinomycetota bacterium]